MLQLVNVTPFSTERAILYNERGEHVWVVVIKATYAFYPDGSLDLANAQEPVSTAPEYFGEAGASTLRRDAEIVFAHPGTAVIINASAYAPDGQPVPHIDAGAAVGPVKKTVRVFGDRHWARGLTRLRVSEPEPFATLPIRYEFAFGGACDGDDSVYEPNPIGLGYCTSSTHAVNRKLPRVEDPSSLIRSWKDRPEPAGLAAIPAAWPSRKRLAGTADEHWIRTRAPLVPRDFDPLFFNAGAPGMTTRTPLSGGEPVVLVNLASQARIEFNLPRVFFNILTYVGNQRIRQAEQLDRVIIEPDRRQVVLVWRSVLNCGRDARAVEMTHIDTKVNAQNGRRFGI
ncbi:DUF2169 family type VI secretion system accessory protein [Burkholderia ubonensis]|uniref:DUF2169 domain-containing protein n=1 Tax=Burkholderia ubonensis subsp. mesacidophila TaxID=265293 RepID=A0A2A4FKS0_9BURK|nr:DUF2169 domain-containing protein [Burkholderia ubonensis]PCE33258.1 hypothetical protein BZL54_05965 [Burkholderia ubonensis subsp. mesacidophila]